MPTRATVRSLSGDGTISSEWGGVGWGAAWSRLRRGGTGGLHVFPAFVAMTVGPTALARKHLTASLRTLPLLRLYFQAKVRTTRPVSKAIFKQGGVILALAIWGTDIPLRGGLHRVATASESCDEMLIGEKSRCYSGTITCRSRR